MIQRKAALNVAAVLLLAAIVSALHHAHNAESDMWQVSTADTGSVAAGSFRLRYQIEGTGPPTIVIGSSVYYPRIFSQNLRRHLRMVFLDHRGFAPSPGPVDTAAFALDTLLDDVERTRQQLGLGPVAVIGHSGHALLALEYAKRYTENVSHVVMIGIAPDFGAENNERRAQHWDQTASAERKTALEAARARLPDEQLEKLEPGEAFIKGYVRDAAQIWYEATFDCTPLWEGVELNVDMISHVWGRTFAEIDITQGLDSLEKPVFMALGRFDFIVAPPSTWDSIAPMFRDLTLRIYEKSGHTPPYEESALFDENLLDWMDRH
jgi:proline iminopeptidase